jgi:hypothetical protein
VSLNSCDMLGLNAVEEGSCLVNDDFAVDPPATSSPTKACRRQHSLLRQRAGSP